MALSKPRIVNKSESRRKEDSKISSSIDRKNNAKKNREAKKAIEQRERQKAAGIERVGGNSRTPTEPTPIRPGTITGEAAPYNPPGQSKFETIMHDQSAKGYNATNGYQMSNTSQSIYNKAHGVAETIRTGVQTEKFQNIPGSQVLGYPVRSTANLIDMGGMIPGGVETLADNPKVIVPALAVGTYQATAGTAQAFKEDPLQTSSDIITGALLTGAAAKIAPKLVGGVGSGIKNVAPKIATRTKPVISDLIAPVKPTTNRLLFDAEIVKIKAQQTGRNVKQNVNDKLFDVETKRLEFMRDEGAQVQLMRPIQRQQYRQVQATRQLTRQQSALMPRNHLKIRRLQVPEVQTGLQLNNMMVAVPGLAINSQITIPVQKQEHITDLMQTQEQITVPMQEQIELTDLKFPQFTISNTKQAPQPALKTLFDTSNGMPGVKMPVLPKAAPKNKNIDIPDVSGWGKRKKSHYVADPKSIL